MDGWMDGWMDEKESWVQQKMYGLKSELSAEAVILLSSPLFSPRLPV